MATYEDKAELAKVAIWDVVFAACVRQAQHPDENGGGIVGRAAAVVNALGLDGDAPVSKLRPLRPATPPHPERNEQYR